MQDAPLRTPLCPVPGAQVSSGRSQPDYLGSGTKEMLARLETQSSQRRGAQQQTRERCTQPGRGGGGGGGDGDFILGAHQSP